MSLIIHVGIYVKPFSPWPKKRRSETGLLKWHHMKSPASRLIENIGSYTMEACIMCCAVLCCVMLRCVALCCVVCCCCCFYSHLWPNRLIITYPLTIDQKHKHEIGPQHRRQVVDPRPQTPQGESVVKPATLLLGILNVLCKWCIKEVRGNCPNPFFKMTARGQKHRKEVDKCGNSSPYIRHFISSKYWELTSQYK